MQHTDCALAFTTDEDIRADLGPRCRCPGGGLGVPGHARSRRCPAAATSKRCGRAALHGPGGVGVVGWRYDVETGADRTGDRAGRRGEQRPIGGARVHRAAEWEARPDDR